MNEIIKKNGIKFGVISGLFSVFYIISMYVVDYNLFINIWLGVTVMLVFLAIGVFQLIELRKSYKTLNYSLVDIDSHFYRVISYPVYLTLITILSSIIMFNIGYQKNTFYKITLGIFLSVIIYYINYFLNILGTNQKIPLVLSIFMPLGMLAIINFTSIIKINEK